MNNRKIWTRAINPQGLYDPTDNGYSHGFVVTGIQRMVFSSGEGGEDVNGVLSPIFEDQVVQAFKNLKRVLLASGVTAAQICKISTFVVDHNMTRLDILTASVKEMFVDTYPAQTLVPVPRLALDGMLFEIEAIAVL